MNRSAMRSAMRVQAASTASASGRYVERQGQCRAGQYGWPPAHSGRSPYNRVVPSEHRLWRRCGVAQGEAELQDSSRGHLPDRYLEWLYLAASHGNEMRHRPQPDSNTTPCQVAG